MRNNLFIILILVLLAPALAFAGPPADIQTGQGNPPAFVQDKINDILSNVPKKVEIYRKAEHGQDINRATGATYRLIHNDSRVIALVPGTARDNTSTVHAVFIGTQAECLAEINRLDLAQ